MAEMGGVQGWVEHHAERGSTVAVTDFKELDLKHRWTNAECDRMEKRAYIRKMAELLEVDLAPGLGVWDEHPAPDPRAEEVSESI